MEKERGMLMDTKEHGKVEVIRFYHNEEKRGWIE